MARLSYSSQAIADIEALTDFLAESDPVAASDTFGLIDEAIAILARHPLIGRPVDDCLRELVISRGKTGYVALYSFEVQEDAILILSIRHQREAGYWQTNAR
ncbi:MAG: type II toxin-antitoxin system RelE/ParE family toxin [Azonexus sp.]